MIMSNTPCSTAVDTWQAKFSSMLPEIQRLLRIAFTDLKLEARSDAEEEALFHCLWSYFSLYEQGRAEAATPSSLVWYAKLQVRRGRVAGCPMNGQEVMSRYAQLGHGFKVLPLNQNVDDDTWVDEFVASRNAPILDQIALRMDFRSWLESLGQRTRRIALDLARGFRTSEVSRKYRVTPGRISQLRRELQVSWQLYQGEPASIVSH
jgi:hypothetical protein